MRLARSTRWTIPLLLALAAPAVAQEGPPPGPPPEMVERLDRVRMERMKAALDLTGAEAEALSARMREARSEMREAMQGQREAMERLHAALRSDPVDQAKVARALETMKRQRRTVEALHERHLEELGRDLTPEKRARLMLFNERFDQRLRELMARRRPPGPERDGPGPGPGRGPGMPGPDMDPGMRRLGPGGPEEAAAVRERISRLEAELDRLRQRLDEIER